MSTLDAVKYVTDGTKDTVNGYLKMLQTLTPFRNQTYDVPPLIVYWCLLYYAAIEQFEATDEIELSDDLMTLKVHETVEGPIEVNGTHEIYAPGNPCKYIWKIKVLNECERDYDQSYGAGLESIGIGICNREYNYLYYESGQVISDDLNKIDVRDDFGSGCQFEQGDIITIEFSVKQRTLKFHINDQKNEGSFSNLDIDHDETYYLCIAGGRCMSLQLIAFHKFYR